VLREGGKKRIVGAVGEEGKWRKSVFNNQENGFHILAWVSYNINKFI